MVVLRNVPFPYNDPISKQPRPEFKNGQDPQAGLVSDPWVDAFTAQTNQLNDVPVKAASVVNTAQSASTAATDFTDGSINGGQYRLSWWYGVTVPNAGASTLQVDFDYQYRGVTKVINGENLVGNSTSEAADTNNVAFITLDGNTPVRYTVNYTTGLGAPMQYDIYICLENVPL